MAADRHRGLGRGLSALLEETQGGAAGEAGAREIPIELIHRNPDQPRQTFDEDALADLAASIADKGVLQPILLRPRPGHPGDSPASGAGARPSARGCRRCPPWCASSTTAPPTRWR
jgi:hypothetical protein